MSYFLQVAAAPAVHVPLVGKAERERTGELGPNALWVDHDPAPAKDCTAKQEPLLEPEYLVAYASEFGACYKPDLTRPSPTAPVRGALDGRHFGQLLRDFFRKLLGG